MNLNAFLSRNRRLLLLCAVSVALHGALLELAARRLPGPSARMPMHAPLALRLAQVSPLPPPAPPMPPAPSRAPLNVPEPSIAHPSRPHEAPPPRPSAAAAKPTSVSQAGKAGKADDAAAAPTEQLAGEHAPQQMPGRYRVRMPGAARLRYQTLEQGRTPASQPAYLDWLPGAEGYSLEFNGILGRLSSRGVGGDAGILPQLAIEIREGGSARTSFDPDSGAIRFEASGASVPGTIGMQDRASLLVQLAAIGLGSGGRMKEEIALVVAGAGAAGVERYRVLGLEDVDTGVGALPAWHLAQLAPAGGARLELWLAPSQDWLPVQLRLTGADGSVSTQLLTGVERP
jgi:hypothetical protein